MRRIFIELNYDGNLSDLGSCHELEKLLEYTDFEIKRFISTDVKNLFTVTIGNG